ncbi:uncharacterized protein KRP23_4319 [Phytophthora ramorum]|uniref:uncharacterized protein n=1 Tax=Phytophthora ramorum TaxID=164328 RepID=UPI0030A0CD34|nr:hypothetical protein KRP23_4319 [Phytophthora ramorum]
MVSVISSPSSADGHEACAATKNKKDPASNELWAAVMREEWRREQQRRRMVRWRQQKKESVASMLQERRVLEKKLYQRLVEARVSADGVVPRTIDEAFRLSTIELASLERENLVLKDTIRQRMKFENMLDHDTREILAPEKQQTSPPKALTKVKSVPQIAGKTGWSVQFPSGVPSFYFTPFTREEYDSILDNNDSAYAQRHPCTSTVGKILGWTVNYAPLTPNADGTFMAHARFTRRVCCSLDMAERILPRMDKNLWPVLVTPRSWGRVQSGQTHCQVLQNISKNAHIMVTNIPGEVNLRYIALARHTRGRSPEGRRVDKYVITIGDSAMNTLNREAEGAQEDVEWILEGGTYITITEVDDETIDVEFDQWAGCLSKMHGRELYIDWVRFPFGLEQCVSSVRLLKV